MNPRITLLNLKSKSNSLDWEHRFWNQPCTPEQRNKLENSVPLREAIKAGDIGKAQEIFISITELQINSRKAVKKWKKHQKQDKEFKKQLKELLGDDDLPPATDPLTAVEVSIVSDAMKDKQDKP